MTQATATGKKTPLMVQYEAIKTKHPGAILLFRVGDFYETFGQDAVVASKILGITLTKRANGAASHIELAGFPHHSLDTYLPKLVKAGQRVAVCDQLENPKDVKGIVKRGVTELVTPGLTFSDHVLEGKSNNFLASVWLGGKHKRVGMALLDISTGEFLCTEAEPGAIHRLLQGLKPAELLVAKAQLLDFEAEFGIGYPTRTLDDWAFAYESCQERLLKQFGAKSLAGFGIDGLPEAVVASGAALAYLELTEHRETAHIRAIRRLDQGDHVWLDRFTIQSLELLHPQRAEGVPLLDILDKTSTPMGARLLRRWILLPLRDIPKILDRLDRVEALVQDQDLRSDLGAQLESLGDMERLASKAAAGRIGPREVAQVARGLRAVEKIKATLIESETPLAKLGVVLDPCDDLAERIEATLRDELPAVVGMGPLIREGVNAELDEWRGIAFGGKEMLRQIQQREEERSGIPKVKVGYNKVFGYFLEVTNAHRDRIPPEWIRKQTLVNAERYITEELKGYEDKILHAEDRLGELEGALFRELVMAVAERVDALLKNAHLVAQLDVHQGFAKLAIESGYARPELHDGHAIQISQGRHPVIEKQLPAGEDYVPNDIVLDDQQQILLITGPNMAGKSALLRQTALIVLMAQMGSFVPAKAARVGVVDKVFTRVGASDNLAQGESTFMVEMSETASILHNLTDRSLLLMDEIGRGTSTYDGLSIAWAIVEYLHKVQGAKPKTLFATHYHELSALESLLDRVKTYHVSVREAAGKIHFLRTLKEGSTEHSFGIHVAQLAGLPMSVIRRAGELLAELETTKGKENRQEKLATTPAQDQLALFDAADPKAQELRERIEALDINSLTPLDALLKLQELKALLG